MQLTLGIISDKLGHDNPQLRPRISGAPHPDRALRGVRRGNRALSANANYVCVVERSDLPTLQDNPPSAAVCRHEDATFFEDGLPACSILSLSIEHVDEAVVLIQDCFDFYADWLERLQSAALHENSLQELLDIAAEPLWNPIALHDPAFALVAKAGPDLPDRVDGSVWEVLLDTGYAGLDRVPRVERYRLQEELRERREPFRSTAASVFSDSENLLAPLYDGENWLATLASTDILRPFTPGQVSLTSAIADVLAPYLAHSQQLDADEDKLAFLAIKVMHERNVVGNQLNLELRKRHWRLGDSYRLMLVERSSDHAAFTSHERFFILKLKHLFPDALIFRHDEHIAIVVNETQENALTRAQQEDVDRLLANVEARMGASLVLENFEALDVGYRQCRACLQFAEAQRLAGTPESRPTQRIFSLGEMFCEVMLYAADASVGGSCFCYPAFLSYARRQKDGGLEAASTVSAYLRFGCNILKTATELNVHRNTLNNRMAKIEEELGCRFKDLSLQEHYLMMTSCLGILAQHPLSVSRKPLQAGISR